MKKIVLIIYIIFISYFSYSQIKNTGNIPFINNYSPEIYEAARQNWDVTQDQRGLLYFANTDGSILEFDGQNWRKIIISTSTYANYSLCVDYNNRIYVGSYNDLGYLEPDKIGNLNFVSIKTLLPKEFQGFQKVWDIFLTKDSSIFFQTFDEIFIYKNDSITILPIDSYYKEGLFLMSYQVNEEIYVYIKYKGIYKFQNKTLEFINSTSELSHAMVRSVLNYKKDTLLIFTWNNGIFTLHNDILTKIQTPIDKIIHNNIYRVINIDENYIAISLYDGGLLIIDKNFKIIQFISSQNGLNNDKIWRMFLDNQKNLWLCTDNGISSVYLFSPFTTLDQSYGFDNEATCFSSILFENKLFLATASGIYYKDWNNFEDKLNNTKFTKLKNTLGNIKTNYFEIVQNKLIAVSSSGIFEIINNTTKYFIEYRLVKAFKIPKNDPNTIVGLGDVIFIFKKINNEWVFSHDIQNIKGNYIEEDENGYFWISNPTTGTYKIKFDKNYNIIKSVVFDTIKGLKGLPNEEIKLFKIDNKLFFTSKSGIFKYDSVYNNFYEDIFWNEYLEKNANIAFVYKDNQENIWFKLQYLKNDQTFFELCMLKKTQDGYKKIRTPFLPIKNKIHSFEQLTDNSYIIGSSTGFIHYDLTHQYIIDSTFPCFIRSVKIINVDSIIFNGTFTQNDNSINFEQLDNQILSLPYKYANLRISFSGAFYQFPDKIFYSYYLEGNDTKWSEWTTENYKEYSNLKPGEYNFIVKAKNIYEIESSIASYKFIIKPPFYLTFLAFVIYFFVASFLVWLIVRIYTRRLRKQKEHLEELVKQRTAEIESQKEEIERQRDKLASQNEEIQKINEDITSSIEYAKRIQTAILPLESTIKNHLTDYFIFFKPRDIVSGDFYWFSNKNNKSFIAAVDCTGHGVPGAFMSMIGAEILTNIVNNQEISDASKILALLNKYIIKALKQDTTSNQDGMDMALLVIDESEKTVEYCGAKNPLFYINKNEFFKLKASKQAIGGFQYDEFERHIIKYESPAYFYIFSDGYADQFGGHDNSKFMVKRFRDMLFENCNKEMNEQKNILEKTILNWMAKNRQTDDILVIGIKL